MGSYYFLSHQFSLGTRTLSSTLRYGTEISLGKKATRWSWETALLRCIVLLTERALTAEGGASGLQSLTKKEDREVLQFFINRQGERSARKKRCFSCIVKCANWIPPLKDRSNKADVVGVHWAVGIIAQN